MTASYRLSDLSDTVAVLGAGFSVAAGLPPVSKLSQEFLNLNDNETRRVITANLRKFWRDVFGYEDGMAKPSFEDHFTLLDLAANVGHNIGPCYTPARLRALRRISIHRVFEILDLHFRESNQISTFLKKLVCGKSALVSLNWDTVVEAHLFRMAVDFSYGIGGRFLDNHEPRRDAFPLIKLHGSANWHYCDSCHTTLFGGQSDGKTTLTHKTFLEANDFRNVLNDGDKVAAELAKNSGTQCPVCRNQKTTARVATFSYAKAFDFFPYHASWDRALTQLRTARRWIFIGYSLPEADFAFKHLLKTAQLASKDPKDVHVIVKDLAESQVVVRYKQFFGCLLQHVSIKGFKDWVRQTLA
ncbi:MAG: hypothetical protein JXB10_07520 [Pirellulales bacterium]|nr:hypothetical protein [Pirellulales bacterium]